MNRTQQRTKKHNACGHTTWKTESSCRSAGFIRYTYRDTILQTCVFMHIHNSSLCLSLSLFLYNICICVYISIYKYIYIYIHTYTPGNTISNFVSLTVTSQVNVQQEAYTNLKGKFKTNPKSIVTITDV